MASGSNEKCVKDIDRVIATKPTATSTTAALPADLATKLDKAAQSSFTQAAGPGAIVGVLKPLALTNTSWPGESPAIPAPYPQGFTLQGVTATPDKPTNATNWNPAWGWTAGEMISNVSDLLVYARALGTGQGLLTPAMQAQRLDSFPGPAGYGLAVGCIGGWVGHTGELPGYNTTLYYDTTSDTTVIVMVNSDIASGDCEVSDTLTDDPRTAVCSSPATRMFVGVSGALGHEFQPNPSK